MGKLTLMDSLDSIASCDLEFGLMSKRRFTSWKYLHIKINPSNLFLYRKKMRFEGVK